MNKATQENPSPAVLSATKEGAVVARGLGFKNKRASRGLLDHSAVQTERLLSTSKPWPLQGPMLQHYFASLVSSSLFHSRYMLGVTVHSHRSETESWKGLWVDQDSNQLLHGPNIHWLWIQGKSYLSLTLTLTLKELAGSHTQTFGDVDADAVIKSACTGASLVLNSFIQVYVHI